VKVWALPSLAVSVKVRLVLSTAVTLALRDGIDHDLAGQRRIGAHRGGRGQGQHGGANDGNTFYYNISRKELRVSGSQFQAPARMTGKRTLAPTGKTMNRPLAI